MISPGFILYFFGYFFFWTRHADFPPVALADAPGLAWPMIALFLGIASWLLTLGAREVHARKHVDMARLCLMVALLLSLAGIGAGLAGPCDRLVADEMGEEVELFFEEEFVILECVAEEREAFGEGAAAEDDLGATA